MVGRQVLVQVAEVVFAKLARAQARGAHRGRQSAVLSGEADLGSRHSHLREPGAVGAHAGQEGGAAGGAGLLAVVVGELDALLGEAVDLILVWFDEKRKRKERFFPLFFSSEFSLACPHARAKKTSKQKKQREKLLTSGVLYPMMPSE